MGIWKKSVYREFSEILFLNSTDLALKGLLGKQFILDQLREV